MPMLNLIKNYKNFHRVQAKLGGFLDDIETTLRTTKNKFDEDSNLAKSIAHFRKNDFTKSNQIIDELIKNNPRDGFYMNLRPNFYLIKIKFMRRF